MNVRFLVLFVCLSMVILLSLGCSKEPPVHQEIIAPPTTPPKVEVPKPADAGMVGASHQEEARVEEQKMTGEIAPPVVPAASAQSPVKPLDGYTVTMSQDIEGVGQMHFLNPSDWTRKRPSSNMRIYQVTIPPVEGDSQPGEVAFFAPIGGSIEDNINRWIGQFSQPDGSDSKAKTTIEDLQGDVYKVKLVTLTGTMLASSMPGMPAQSEKTGWMMLGTIIETPSGPWYVKATGPEKTMSSSKEKFIALSKSIQIVSPSAPAPGSGTTQP
jgi:hypothetical protein